MKPEAGVYISIGLVKALDIRVHGATGYAHTAGLTAGSKIGTLWHIVPIGTAAATHCNSDIAYMLCTGLARACTPPAL